MTDLSAEVIEIAEQLGRSEPFDRLDPNLLATIATACRVVYHRAGHVLSEPGAVNHDLWVVARGSLELRTDDGSLRARVGEGNTVGVVSALSGRPARHRCVLLEDSVLYRIDGDVITGVRRRAGIEFDQYLISLVAERTPVAPADVEPLRGVLTDSCRQLVRRPPVTVDPSTTVIEAARRMTDEGVSAVIAISDGTTAGILTDRDLRRRVVAAAVDPATALVAEVMTAPCVTMEADEPGHQALLAMAEHNIHHLPVLSDRRPIGLLTLTDLAAARANDPVTIVGRLAKAATVEAVAAGAAASTAMVESLMAADATAETTGRLVSAITDAVTRRLCALAEAELGPPPVDYAFVCFGSQARQEQTAFTDQDNGIILADDARPEHEDYFAGLAAFVCDGLDRAGYRYCPGDIMATNPDRRLPLARWLDFVDAWVAEPDPQAVLNASVYFDVRHLVGSAALTEAYSRHALRRAGASDLFLGHLAAGGAGFRPPIGFFRRFVVERDGEQKDRFDLKRTGVTPVVHLARAYALSAGVAAVNTYDRLRAVGDTPLMAPADAADLVVALEYVGYVRLQHQHRQLARGEAPDNFVNPDLLTRLEREQLRRAFVAIDRQQDAMRRRFNTAQMG